MYKGIEVIAEVKIKSPFGFESENSWDELFKIANEVGDIISIHTNQRWGGNFDLIRKAKSLTSKPILAKGIHYTDSEIEKAIRHGADYVLVVGRIPSKHREKCWIEPVNLKQLSTIPSGMKVVWNSRDLITGKNKTEQFEEARNQWKGWICQASFIKNKDDIKKGANAVLVGEHLKEFADSLK